MMLLALALLLAQTAAPQTPAVTTPAAIDASVRRAPIAFAFSKDAALIENSGSTNFEGFAIAVETSGSALIREPNGVRRGSISAATAKSLFSLLAANRRLGRIAVDHCMKPVSFGSTTTVTWRGQRTPDLSCGGSAAAQDLSRTAGAIERQLGVEPQRRGLRYPQ